jgi:RimJ/RimL family protein N-acetyltransferase
MPHQIWPLFDLEVRTPRLTLRYVDDDLGVELAELAARGVHDPASMPFAIPWTDVPPPLQQRNTLQFYWRVRADHRPDSWHLTLAALTDGVVVGTSSLIGEEFAVARTVSTGSWIGLAHQGTGLGRELREATLHLAFAGLDALEARSGAWCDNQRSIAVSRRLGYEDNGTTIGVRRGERAVQQQFRLPRDRWERIRRDDITIVGLDPCRFLLGATA